MFDPPSSQRYPRKWAEMSLDYKLMFVYHGSVMVMFITGDSLSIRTEISLIGSLLVVLACLSIWRRHVAGWRWPSVTTSNVLGALFGVVAMAFFLYSATPGFPPSDPGFLPWYLGGLGIGIFGILSALRVVDAAEADFLQSCVIIDEYGREVVRTPPPPKPADTEPAWKKSARGTFYVAFVLMWLLRVGSFFSSGKAFQHGLPQPLIGQAEALTEHSRTVYITSTEKVRIDTLNLVSGFGIPLLALCGAILHFLVGVKLIPDVPTLAEYRARKSPTS